ncbi:family 16 glycosylhydrolase [Hymenobacter sublimis]|uniref:Family 16 glycosylhydrolase n=1 Tax=Hymenobacter sublimis TaxID=2933777 RepID=A0ABY4JEE9_9BACT|nr:family 16 glycosylhydrolase [Hymenobacter sublimis]UPL50126.1 family 16 glycosylhydrolase [Hymenobacter sublimis]
MFQDEFNYRNVDELKASGNWEVDGLDGWGTEYYAASQVEFPGGGILRLKADVVPAAQRAALNTAARRTNIAYVSGRIMSTKAYDPVSVPAGWAPDNWAGFAYGMFEIRCKLPANGKGVWPTFWLLSAGTEIDVIDNGNDEPRRQISSGVLDWDKRNQLCATSGSKGCDTIPLGAWTCGGRSTKDGRDLSQDFNTYTVVWTPTQVTFFLNDREQYTVTSSQVQTHAYTARILANLQMTREAVAMGITHAEMDIDYITVYKPLQGQYAVSYDQSEQEYVNYVFKKPINDWLEYVSPRPGSIAVNPNNKDELFFCGTNGLLYRSLRSLDNQWVTSEVDPAQAHHRNWQINGELHFNPKHNLVTYRGHDGRLQSYSFYSGWIHGYVSPAAPLASQPSTTSGSVATATNGDLYYIGQDRQVQLLHRADTAWVHSYLSYAPTADSTAPTPAVALGDLVLDNLANGKVRVYYKGLDYRIHVLEPANETYTHYLLGGKEPVNGTVHTSPGSIVASGLGSIFYIGADRAVHRYQWSGDNWVHDALTPNNQPGFLSAKGNIAWDDVKKQAVYVGADGRLQSFYQNAAGTWLHRWIDSYYNTNRFKCFTATTESAATEFPSLAVGPSGNIFYRAQNNELRFFAYTGCRYRNPTCENWNMTVAWQGLFNRTPGK